LNAEKTITRISTLILLNNNVIFIKSQGVNMRIFIKAFDSQ